MPHELPDDRQCQLLAAIHQVRARNIDDRQTQLATQLHLWVQAVRILDAQVRAYHAVAVLDTLDAGVGERVDLIPRHDARLQMIQHG